MTIEYKRSLTELNTILNYMSIELIKKVPAKFINFISTNMDKEYKPDINKNIPIHEQNISKDTKVLLSLMYRNYWCDEATKIELLHQDLLEKQKYEEKLREKYNVDNIFKNRNKEIDIEETIVKEEIHALTEYKEKNFIQKIFDKIKSIFKRK